MTKARLKWFGWGREGEGMTAAERAFVLGRYHEKFGKSAFETVAVPSLDDLALPAPRVAPPAALASVLHFGALRPGRAYLRQILPRLCPRNARAVRRRPRRRRLSPQ